MIGKLIDHYKFCRFLYILIIKLNLYTNKILIHHHSSHLNKYKCCWNCIYLNYHHKWDIYYCQNRSMFNKEANNLFFSIPRFRLRIQIETGIGINHTRYIGLTKYYSLNNLTLLNSSMLDRFNHTSYRWLKIHHQSSHPNSNMRNNFDSDKSKLDMLNNLCSVRPNKTSIIGDKAGIQFLKNRHPCWPNRSMWWKTLYQ